ncbi:MAG: lytic murein transglycosylase B [Methylococcales bacterium]|nr:lytic murein transglycosylase B [Methylococcales bacterium]
MKLKTIISATLLPLFVLSFQTASAAVPETRAFNRFIEQMVNKHGFEEEALRKRFNAVEIQPSIPEAMAAPAEAKPWFEYREIFMTEDRIEAGVKFWQKNEQVLGAIEKKYRVPAEILVAIIGVESKYGEQAGKYREIDALSTLSFAYPPRSKFFTRELASYLLLCRKAHINPMKPAGAYNGAMGLPQFMPSRFQSFAVDFNHDHKKDIWNDSADAAASIARYLAHHGWRSGEAVAFPVKARSDAYRGKLDSSLKPDVTIAQLRALQVEIPSQLPDAETVKLLGFQHAGGEDLWIGLHNFYVLTRYHSSPLYAMAVYQLSQVIADRKKAFNSAAELQQ